MTIVAVFAVGLVVPAVVADHVAHGEAVVRGHEIDAGPGAAVAAVEYVARTGQPGRHVAALAVVPAPVAPHRIAVAIVPFSEAGRMVAQLIAVRADVPRLGNELGMRQLRVLQQGVEEARAGIEAGAFPPQGDAQVEAEPSTP